MSEKFDKATRVRNKIMGFVGNTKIRDQIIQEGKTAVYVERNVNGDFLVEVNKSGVIRKTPYKRQSSFEI